MNGNREAQKIIYNKYKKIIYNFIKSKYKQYSDIDDDISEIIIKVFLNLDNYDNSKSEFKTWVLTITKNYMIDKWRCSNELSQSSTLSPENNEQIIYNNYMTTNDDFENNNSINFISSQLSSSEYMLLDMKYLQGYNYNEIGQEFNLTSNTVSNKVNYIKTKIKKNYSEIINE